MTRKDHLINNVYGLWIISSILFIVDILFTFYYQLIKIMVLFIIGVFISLIIHVNYPSNQSHTIISINAVLIKKWFNKSLNQDNASNLDAIIRWIIYISTYYNYLYLKILNIYYNCNLLFIDTFECYHYKYNM